MVGGIPLGGFETVRWRSRPFTAVKRPPVIFSAGNVMALASGLVTAADDQEQAAAGLSNATPALLPATIDCYRMQPDGRLHHRNRPFVLVGATGWVCPLSRHSRSHR